MTCPEDIAETSAAGDQVKGHKTQENGCQQDADFRFNFHVILPSSLHPLTYIYEAIQRKDASPNAEMEGSEPKWGGVPIQKTLQ